MNLALKAGTPTKIKRQIATAEQERRETIFRLAALSFLAITVLVSFFGTGWDIEWHLQVGRDGAFSPPHVVIYTALGIIGVSLLLTVLVQTWRYWRGSPTVTPVTTTPILGLFHAPLGFTVAGFGILAMVIAAPLDDYWHQLYGIDVALWSPFHMMGIISSSLAQIGLMLAFASEYNRTQSRYQQTRLKTDRRLVWVAVSGLAVTGATLLAKFTLVATPAAVGLSLTPWQLPIYALILALLQPLVLVAVVVATRRIGVASLTSLFFWLIQLGITLLVPWAVANQIASEGLQIRPDNPAILLNLHTLETALPVWLPVAGLLVDLILLLSLKLKNKKADVGALVPENFMPPKLMLLTGGLAGLVLALLNRPYEVVQQRAHEIATQFSSRAEVYPDWLPRLLEFNPNVWAALPIALGLGVASGWLGYQLGLIMRYLSR